MGLHREFQGTNPRAWLFRIAHNVAVDYLRHEDHHCSLQMPTVDGDAGSPDRSDLADALIEQEEMTKIYQALHALPPHYRNVLVLCGVFTLSAHEASVILGWSLPKLYITRHRARKALARVLSD